MTLMFICLFSFSWIPVQAHMNSFIVHCYSFMRGLPPSSHNQITLYIVSIVTNSKRNPIQIFVWLKKKRGGGEKKPLLPLHCTQNKIHTLAQNLNLNTIYLYAQQRLLSTYVLRYILDAGGTQSMPIDQIQHHRTKNDFKPSIPKRSRTLMELYFLSQAVDSNSKVIPVFICSS